MDELTRDLEVLGPWSLEVSRRFWEGFAPNRLGTQRGEALEAVFLVEHDWTPARVRIEQVGSVARLHLQGVGDLAAAADQAARFLAIDVDGTGWPAIGERDTVVAQLQRTLAGFRPCGFFSPYEAAAWAVLAQRTRMSQATALRSRLIRDLGEDGAFPAPDAVRHRDLGLPGRKGEYLDAVCDAALEGVLDGAGLRFMDADAAIERVQRVKGIGPFAAGLVVVRGANHPDALPPQEPRLDAEVERRYGAGTRLADVADGWRPFRTWVGVSLRATSPDAHGLGG